MKTCTKCGEEKPISDFSKRSASPDGLQYKCRPCAKAEDKELYDAQKNDPETWDKIKERKRKWTDRNRDQSRAYHAKRQREDAVYRANHASRTRRRQAAKLQRTPSWANDQLISAYYKEAKRLEELTGIQFHVDHIIPLRGELVSGLHVETNLQLLPAHENQGKSNRFDPETFVA